MLFDEEEIPGKESYQAYWFDAEGIIFQIELHVGACSA
jgi:uncharacterized protein YcfL